MKYHYPKFPVHQLPTMLRLALLGAALAGPYGAAHDQISYALSPEYFTKQKFDQFAWANLGWPPRAFASVVGFLATWWVGLIAGWLLARAGLAELPGEARRKRTLVAFAIVIGVAVAGVAAGALLGVAAIHADVIAWEELREDTGVEDGHGYVVVAFLHWGGYLGALLGLVAGVRYVRRERHRMAEPHSTEITQQPARGGR